MFLKIFKILILNAFLICTVQSAPNELNETERDRISRLAYDYAQLSLAQRVSCNDINCREEVPNSYLFNNVTGVEELLEYYQYLLDLYLSVWPEDLRTESDENSDLRNAYVNYFNELIEFHFTEFWDFLSLGYVQTWPRYYYEPSSGIFHVIPAVLNFQRRAPSQRSSNDLGPEANDVLQIPYDMHKKLDRNKPGIYQTSTRWVSKTPLSLQNRAIYQLDHIIPHGLLVRFFNLFFSVVSNIDNIFGEEHEISLMLRAFSRILSTINRSDQINSLGYELNSLDKSNFVNFYTQYNQTAKRYSRESTFNYHERQLLLWAPGNLFWGFGSRSDSVADNFELNSQVILGGERFARARRIHDRIERFTNEVGYTKKVNKQHTPKRQESMRNIRRNLSSNTTMLEEMFDIFAEYFYYAFERYAPYPNDKDQWEQEEKNKWRIKTMDEYEKFLRDQNRKRKHDGDDDDDAASGGVSPAKLGGICRPVGKKSRVARKKRSVVDNQIKSENFKYYLLKNLISKKSDAVLVLQDFQKNNPYRNSVKMSELNDFAQNKLVLYYQGHCTDKDWICSRVNHLCHHEDTIILVSDENDDPKYRKDVILVLKLSDLKASVSIPDWCNGVQYENGKTTNSAFVKIMTFKTSDSKKLNKKIYYDLHDEFVSSGKEISFLRFVDDQLDKVDSTANKALIQACRKPEEENLIKLKIMIQEINQCASGVSTFGYLSIRYL